MKILSIETSCDETAIAVLEVTGKKNKPVFKLLANKVLSQINIHKPFGGVVPNLAMREHQKNLVPILEQALKEADLLKKRASKKLLIKEKISKNKSKEKSNIKIAKILTREPILFDEFIKFTKKFTVPDIDAIAITYGPGLEPALWVGINFAKALSLLWKKKLIPVNHLEGHIYAGFLPKEKEMTNFKFPKTKNIFPALALIVSGGHTELVLAKSHGKYKMLGETRDDAAGEAFDKVAKMLKLGYPGGPEISKLAEHGDPAAINFPRPMINSKDFDFSFSGLKTSVLYYLRDVNVAKGESKLISESASEPAIQKLDMAIRRAARKNSKSLSGLRREEINLLETLIVSDIAASFEQAIIDVLISKTAQALTKYKVKSLVVGGGVAANKKLRASIEYMMKLFSDVTVHLSPIWLTGDNATMIATAAYFHLQKKKNTNLKTLKASGNLQLK